MIARRSTQMRKRMRCTLELLKHKLNKRVNSNSNSKRVVPPVEALSQMQCNKRSNQMKTKRRMKMVERRCQVLIILLSI